MLHSKKKAADAFKNLVGQSSLIMVSHGEGTLKQFCTAGIYLHNGQADWYDNLEDALAAYKNDRK
ncbi:hypothetical protein [Methylocucumis oryzae]|uniref:hypothetical protein n=1 Tax=Methylocucumis oryzae TaxID=1632867 RepID=UPI000A8EF7AD|nr:hypothetical protein [Methylocucumis oryzae]